MKKNIDMNIRSYEREMWTLPKDYIYHAIESIQVGLEYAQETLIKHDIELGRTTRSNKFVAEQIEQEILKMKDILLKFKNYESTP